MNSFIHKIGCFGLLAALLAAVVGGPYAEATDKVKAVDPVKKFKNPEVDVPQHLQDISVTVRANFSGGWSEGSGVFKITKDGQVWVWTCGHVLENLRSVRKNSDGKTMVEFADAKIIKTLTENGRKVGEMIFDAEVMRYSDSRYGDDLALLRLRSKQFKPASSTTFYLDDSIPTIGTRLLHCGSLLGSLGSNSVTNGIVSQVGRVLFNDTIFDQTNCAAFPGSSGGIICLEKDGRYIGMLVRGAGETFSIYVPVRRMIDWAKRTGVYFAMDDALDVPTLEEIRKTPVDDSQRGFTHPPVPAPEKGPKEETSRLSFRVLTVIK